MLDDDWEHGERIGVTLPMARFTFDFDDDGSVENAADMASLDAAVVAAAASLALTAMESGKGQAESVVVVGNDKGPQARISLSIKVEPLS